MSIGKYEITTGNGVNRLEIEVLFDGIPSKPLTAEYRDGEWCLIQTCPVCHGIGTVPVTTLDPRSAQGICGPRTATEVCRTRWPACGDLTPPENQP